VRGRLYVTNSANHVVIRHLYLDGRNRAKLPSPTVNGNHVVFEANDITTRNTTICFVLGSDEYGRARHTVIERNRIHDCGDLPPTNHHHGIYVEASYGARIVGNWIYDNADRGVQMFPDAQRTYVARNVIDGNGEGVVFSRRSAHNLVEHNVISNPVVRYNIEDFELTGTGNVAQRNCLWSARHAGSAAVSPAIAVQVLDNVVTEPFYFDRARKDFRLRPDSPCFGFSPGMRRPGPRTP
jgi:nitrous oxidase accessory protein NosD